MIRIAFLDSRSFRTTCLIRPLEAEVSADELHPPLSELPASGVGPGKHGRPVGQVPLLHEAISGPPGPSRVLAAGQATRELAVSRKPVARPRKTRSLPRSQSPEPPEPSRRPRTLLLGLASFGIVVLFLVGIGGIIAFLSRDQLAPAPRQNRQVSPLADAVARKEAAPVIDRTDKPAPGEGPDLKDHAPPAETVPLREMPREQPASGREPEPAPPPKPPAAEVKRPIPKVSPKPAAPPKTETPNLDSSEPVEASKSTPPPVASAEPRRLSGDQIYRRLVKSTVFVLTGDSWGSGSLIHRERRLILTNYHVVGDNSEVSVSFPRYDKSGKLIVEGDSYLRAFKNREFIRGKVLKVAKGQDLALVQLETIPQGTPVLKLSAKSAEPGQTVHSVGNPGASDARWSYTSGTVRQVSHKNWKVKVDRAILAFDADVVETQSPTNPGDSGGPLVHESRRRHKPKACLHAMRALAHFGAEAREAVPDLQALLKSEDREVLAQALALLRKIGPAAGAAAADLIELLKDADRSLRLPVAFVLVAIDPKAIGEGKDALAVLVLALRPETIAEMTDPQAKERVKEIGALLVKIGEPAAERLLKAIESEFRGGRSRTEAAALNAAARVDALNLIAKIGLDANSNKMLSALGELQRTDPSRAVRDAAKQAYIKIQGN